MFSDGVLWDIVRCWSMHLKMLSANSRTFRLDLNVSNLSNISSVSTRLLVIDKVFLYTESDARHFADDIFKVYGAEQATSHNMNQRWQFTDAYMRHLVPKNLLNRLQSLPTIWKSFVSLDMPKHIHYCRIINFFLFITDSFIDFMAVSVGIHL